MTQTQPDTKLDRLRPLAEELRPAPDPLQVLQQLRGLPHCIFLDSARRVAELGRYSFLAADPLEFLTLRTDEPHSLQTLRERLIPWRAQRDPELPPFQGGVAGLFGYDLNRGLERLPAPRWDEFQVPALAVGCYDVVVAFDHDQQRAWVISQGRPGLPHAQRRQHAHARLDRFRQLLDQPAGNSQSAGQPSTGAIPRERLAPQHRTATHPLLTSNFSADGYRAAVARAIEYIRAGDVFQVNLAQRLLYPAGDDSLSLYLRLRQCNAAPFAAYFDLGTFQIVSASPERFLSLRDGRVEARPIKGTRQRCCLPEADLFGGGELLESEKDRAENVMIVDLLRNDISRVCVPDSVKVQDLCRLETYQFVQHLVSVITGSLCGRHDAIDLLSATFPGGSITGAPKVRAMEIIQELEPTARGPYCGSLGYIGCDGTMDLSILIRTITAGRGWWQFPVGGGVVAQSDPDREYQETWHKAIGLVRALRP